VFTWLVPVEGVILVIVAALSLYFGANLGQDDQAAATPDQAQWRLAWAVCALSLVCAWAWSIASSVFVIRHVLVTACAIARERWLHFAGVFSIVIGLLLIVLLRHPPRTSGTDDLTYAIMQHGSPHIVGILAFGNTITAATIALVALSCSAIALPFRMLEIRLIVERMRDYRALLYSSSALLVIGVLEMYTLQRWGDSYGPAHPAADEAALAMGAVYTLALIMLFLPIAPLRDRWLCTLTSHELLSESQLVEAKSLQSSTISVAGVTAMLLPVLTSVATAVAKRTLGVP
jgi:hypothetical protein